MSPSEQQSAIASACGLAVPCGQELGDHTWMDWQSQSKPFLFRFRCCKSCPALHIEGEQWPTWDNDKVAPDYLNDLNAMRDAEWKAGPAVVKAMRFWLWQICDEMTAHSASAAQRAEAFLRATGRWTA